MRGSNRDWRGWFRGERANLPATSVALVLTLGAYFWRLHLLRVRDFDQDEFEHLHAAWSISKGMLPYRDFFEHHTPWLYFFLAPFYALFDVETNVEEAHAFLFFARTWMWLFTGAILVLTIWLGGLWRDARVACAAALFLGSTRMFLQKTLEVRPDVPAVAFWLACLVLALRGVRDENPDMKTRWRFAWSGAFLGAAVMCTQKMLFALPGFSAAMLWYLVESRSRGGHRQRLWNVACQIVGFCVPILLTLIYFALRGSLAEFIEYNVLLNARWEEWSPPIRYLALLPKHDPILVALAIAGFFRAALGMFAPERFRRGEFMLVLSALGLFVGLFIMPMPLPQYHLMFLPLGAVFAAGLLVDAVDGAGAALRGQRVGNVWSSVSVLGGITAFGALLVLAFRTTAPHLLDDPFYMQMWGVALSLALLSLLMQRRNVALVLLLVALSVYPLKHMRDVPNWSNAAALDEIRYVLQHTSPSDTCLDGFTGRGVFRPHAWFYWFLPRNFQAMLSDGEKDELFTGLVSGAITPTLIFFDHELEGLPEETRRFVAEHYEPVGTGSIWRRR